MGVLVAGGGANGSGADGILQQVEGESCQEQQHSGHGNQQELICGQVLDHNDAINEWCIIIRRGPANLLVLNALAIKANDQLETHQEIIEPIKQEKIIPGKVFPVIQIIRAMPFIN